MRIFKTVTMFVMIIALLSACSGAKEEEKAVKFDSLKIGDKFEGLNISELTQKDGLFVIKFSDELEIEGTLIYFGQPFALAISNNLFKTELDVNDELIDLSIHDISMVNDDKITCLLTEEMLDETPNGFTLKQEFVGNIKVKIKVKDIYLSNDGNSVINATIVDVIEFNGEKNPKPAKRTSTDIKTVRANFNVLALSSDGSAWLCFNDEDGNEYTFYDDGNENVRNLFGEIQPNNSNHKYVNTLFEIEYQVKEMPYYNKYEDKDTTRIEKVISSIVVVK